MQIVSTAPRVNSAEAPTLLTIETSEPTTEALAAVTASFCAVAARGCRNSFARRRLQDAVRAALDAAEAIRRDERRMLGGAHV